MIIDEYTLQESIGNGAFGEVFLTTKSGTNQLFATKKVLKEKIEAQEIKKYFVNEIMILKEVSHPNIIKFEAVKHTVHNYYIITEYCNGGAISQCLKKYKALNGHSFTEEIVQHLMRQIVDALKYLHGKNIIHRDIKLDNILLNFSDENQKNNMNLLKAKVKIIDFGFATHINKSKFRFSTLGSPVNMDPILLKKLTSKNIKANLIGYDEKADIWSLGTICYEMLIGEGVFNAQNMNDLVKKVECGNYHVPTNLSKEVVSFLNGMLQYDAKNRLSAEELSRHYFLNKNVIEFKKIDLKEVTNKIDNKGLNINIKRNQSIWAIFSEQDERALINIPGGFLNVNINQEKNNNNGNMYNNNGNPKENQINQKTLKNVDNNISVNNIQELINKNNNDEVNIIKENRNIDNKKIDNKKEAIINNITPCDNIQKVRTMENNNINLNLINVAKNQLIIKNGINNNLLNKNKTLPEQINLQNNQNLVYIKNNNNNNQYVKNGQVIQNNHVLNIQNNNKNYIPPNNYNPKINQPNIANNVNKVQPKNIYSKPGNIIPYYNLNKHNSRTPIANQRNNNFIYTKYQIPQENRFHKNNIQNNQKVLNNNQQKLRLPPGETNNIQKIAVPKDKIKPINRIYTAKTPKRIINNVNDKNPNIFHKVIQNEGSEKNKIQNLNQNGINHQQMILVPNTNVNNINIICPNKDKNILNNKNDEGPKNNTKDLILDRKNNYGNKPKINIKINVNSNNKNNELNYQNQNNLVEINNIAKEKINLKTEPKDKVLNKPSGEILFDGQIINKAKKNPNNCNNMEIAMKKIMDRVVCRPSIGVPPPGTDPNSNYNCNFQNNGIFLSKESFNLGSYVYDDVI